MTNTPREYLGDGYSVALYTHGVREDPEVLMFVISNPATGARVALRSAQAKAVARFIASTQKTEKTRQKRG
jgi:hypothetical protein